MKGRFGWYELYTTDPEAAQKFYGAIVGWTTQKWDASADYTMWVAPSGPVGGVMLLPEAAKAMGAPPHWMGYVGVANADSTVARAKELGANVYVPPTDLPNGSRFAVLADPQGAAFAVHQSASEEGPAGTGQGLGEFTWAELLSADPDAGFAFYAELFGWVKNDGMDMGAMGTYQMFGQPGERSMGGMMRKPEGMPVSAWLHYAVVADADVAAAKVKELGGTVIFGPDNVPGNGRIATFIDPQGATCAVYAQM